MRRLITTAAFAVLASVCASPAAAAADADEALLARPGVVELPGPGPDLVALRRLVVGVAARPHVQRPAAVPARQTVLRARPGRVGLRSGAR